MEVLEAKTKSIGIKLEQVKIHFDNQIFRLQKYGGISRYFVRLAEQLLSMNQSPKILGGFHINAYLRDLDSSIAKGFYVDKYPKGTIRLLRDSGKWINKGYSFLAKPDIVHETYFSAAPVLRGGKRRVITEYDSLHELYPDLFPQNQIKTQEKKIAFERSDLVLAISHQTKSDMMEFFDLPEDKIQVTHLAADPKIEDHLIEYPESSGRPFLLFVGIRLKHKNFERFVRAFAASDRMKSELDLVVFTPFPFSQEEYQLFKEIGLTADQVKRVSGDDHKLFGYFKTARAFVYPSLYEGFGIPPLEAMTYDCPVVCSNNSSLPEVVGDAALTFDPSTIEEMTTQMEKMAFEDSLRTYFIQKGKERRALFSWEKTAKETLHHYQSLV